MGLAIIPATDELAVINSLAAAFRKSGLFADTADEAKAVVKILAGREMGIPAVQAMMGLNIIKGRLTMSANLMASKIKSSGRYTYRVLEHSNSVCKIAFIENGEQIGVSEFTIEDAEKAGLVKNDSNWTKWPRNMLFARALSNGAKWYTPDVFESAVYTPDELGAYIDGETGEIISGPHWTQTQDWSKFWGFVEAVGLTREEALAALEVENAWEFKGTKEEALEILNEAADTKNEEAALEAIARDADPTSE